MATTNEAAASRVNSDNRMDIAVNALDAVRDLCCEAANAGPRNTLAHVDADNLACLLGLILDEMRSAQDEREEASRPH